MIKKKWRPNNTRYALNEILENHEFCYAVDTETTGLDFSKDKIIEIGIVKLQVSDGKFIPIDELDIFINPEQKLIPKIESLTGITNDFLTDKATEKTVFNQIYDFLGENPVFIAYNSNFDVNMVKSMYARNTKNFEPIIELDVLAMARDLIAGKDTKNGKFNLQTIAEALNLIEDGVHFHLAIDDIKMTVKILNELSVRYSNQPEWTCGADKTQVLQFWHWESPYNHNQNAVYVRTTHGTFTINDMSHFCQDKDMGVIDAIDVEDALRQVARKAWMEYSNYDTFCIELPKIIKKKNKKGA